MSRANCKREMASVGGSKERVVVVGGGVIGACVSLYLQRRGRSVLLLEGLGIACAASGSAGGFLSRNMCDGTAMEALQRRSFDLHAHLASAQQLDGKSNYDYRELEAFSIDFGDRAAGGAHEADAPEQPVAHRPRWLSDDVCMRQMHRAPPGTTAQLHPRKFTETVVRAAERAGACVLVGGAGHVQGISVCDGRLRSVTCSDGIEHHCDAVVVAAGPWTGHVMHLLRQNLPDPRVVSFFPSHGRLSHSVVVSPSDDSVIIEPYVRVPSVEFPMSLSFPHPALPPNTAPARLRQHSSLALVRAIECLQLCLSAEIESQARWHACPPSVKLMGCLLLTQIHTRVPRHGSGNVYRRSLPRATRR